ncbi:hypothetical protein AXF42_Ash008880 [Apostasia shenzhenica]|uniref:Uncharacterized protein n=1 Tax=Apostasia shenzhenica TaxID=1088818 RepID=A0A2I0ASR6_9ASPA|nr:hypothetical protein AXF42_Ash008880 [Apostasia shenzhenica]
MDRRESAPQMDPLISSPRSTSQEERSLEEDQEEVNKRVKRAKMRDLKSLLRSKEEMGSSKLESLKEKNFVEPGSRAEEVAASQITEIAALRLSEKSVASFDVAATVLSLGYGSNLQSSAEIASELEPEKTKVIHEPCLPTSSSIEPNAPLIDLNNPFYPFKELGQIRFTDTSECGSTTGPVENNESMRKWKEMKRNGFLTSFQELAPIPKPRGRQLKKKKTEEMKRKIDMKSTKFVAPSGLLSGLNPGIIKHVRNSKQVNSIIEAMLQNEQLEKEHTHTSLDDRTFHSDIPQQNPNHDINNNEHVNSKYDDSLALKLSSGVSFNANAENISSHTFKAATVASQWLELIQLDIKGRLAALRRSKRRVKNAIQIELPSLLSRDFASEQLSENLSDHSSSAGCSKREILDMHMARWKAVFGQMERSLLEEGKQLEKWLRQVEELQSECEKGLKYVSANGLPLMDSVGDVGVWKSREAWEREHAVRAAAASIYSTSNMIMAEHNVPCF